MAREADVIIVGAGLSGLVAGRELLDAGWEPLVLEADERIGGRILTQEVDGVSLELGAQWIGDTHHRMEALAEELGVKIYDQFEDGETTYEFAGEVLRGDAFHAKYAAELTGLESVLRELDRMADTVPVEAPWTAPRADEWDRITVGQWYDSQGLSPVARTLLEICTVGILAMPTVEVSLLCLLENVAVCGVTADLLAESEGGAQTKRFVGGTSLIPLRLADTLGEQVTAGQLSPFEQLSTRLLASAWWAARRDTVSLLEAVHKWEALARAAGHNPELERWAEYGAASGRAYAALARRDTAEAVRRFAELPDSVCPCLYDRILTAHLLSIRGRPSEAAKLLERSAPLRFWDPFDGLWWLERARLAELLNEPAKAIEAYRYVADLWRHADPELQLYVREARAGVARLGGTKVSAAHAALPNGVFR